MPKVFPSRDVQSDDIVKKNTYVGAAVLLPGFAINW